MRLEVRVALDLLKTQLEAVPGVEGVTPVVSVPFVGWGGGIDGPLYLPGQSKDEAVGNPVVNMEVVAPNYFATLHSPRRCALLDRERS